MQAFTPKRVGATLRYFDLPGRGTPLLFLHGMGCAATSDYPRVADARALRDRRRLLVDLLGSGYSDRPARFPYTVEAHAATIVALIEHLKLPKVHLYGHSMSGAVAIVVAHALPRRVTRLVLSEPNLDPGGGTTSRAIARQPVARYVASGHARLAAASRRPGQDTWAASLSLSLPAAIHREAVSLVRGSSPSWRQLLTGMRMPRTVIFGQQSLPDPDTDRLRAAGLAVRVVPRAGHGMAQDNPDGLAEALAASIA